MDNIWKSQKQTKSGIYGIYNTVSNKWYIGSAIVIKQRWRSHRHNLNNNKHGNNHLQLSWNKYGEGSFKFKILEYVEDKNKLVEYEQRWINWMECCNPSKGYNKALLANSNLGIKQNLSSIAKRLETRIKNGYKHSNETKRKISEAHKGRKISNSRKGFKLKPEQIARIIAMNTGRKHSSETIEKRKLANAGFKHTKETKIKLAQLKIGNEARRNKERWPCKDGVWCKCECCNKQRKLEQSVRNKNRYSPKKFEIINA